MFNLIKTPIGRLRIAGFLEGVSLIVLVLIAMPMKYVFGKQVLVHAMGPVHSLLFCLFVFLTLSVSITHRWKFSKTTWKVLISCIIPFGTFYVDKFILSEMSHHLDDNL
jgi:integral membrane protein